MPINILITITPSFGNLMQNGIPSAELQNYINENRMDLIFFKIMNSTKELKERLMRYFEDFPKLFKDRSLRTEILQQVGSKILDYAKQNVESGYTGTESIDHFDTQWVQRSEITKRLYTLRGYNPEAEGMFTRATVDQDGQESSSLGIFVDSFSIGTNLNIFLVKADVGIVVLGTRFKHAEVLENGGKRTGSHLGFPEDETGQPHIAGWLIQALIDVEGYSEDMAELKAKEIYNELQLLSTEKIPSRPFLKPALYYVQHRHEAIEIINEIILYDLKRKFENMPMWAQMYDKITVEIVNNEGEIMQ